MKVAVIASAGASPLFEVARACPHVEFVCLTDRRCGAERGCAEHGIAHERIEEKTNRGFSAKAARSLDAHGSFAAVILLFGRLVEAPLLGEFPVLNVHPALLPAFRGVGAVRAALAAGVRVFGATLHGITERTDDGPIVAQVWSRLNRSDSLERLQKISFLHKTYLMLLTIDLLERGQLQFNAEGPRLAQNLPACGWANPSLQNLDYAAHFDCLSRRDGIDLP